MVFLTLSGSNPVFNCIFLSFKTLQPLFNFRYKLAQILKKNKFKRQGFLRSYRFELRLQKFFYLKIYFRSSKSMRI